MLLASSLLGALTIMDSAGFISLFIGIEMLSLPAFAMMVSGDGTSSSSEGAFKYLVLSSVATALILFGLSLVYGATGSLSIGAFVAAATAGGAQSLAASIVILSGFFLKAAVFPFHAWAPDAYSSVRIHVTAFLASVIKGAVVLALVRILSTLALSSEVVAAVTVLSVASIFYGNTTAVRQASFKKLLAYSSIAHAGYMMFALIDSTGGRTEALLYYVSVYALTTIIACACFGLMVPGEKDDLDLLDGAFSRNPVAAVLLALAVLSMAGIPPLPGFFAKFLIFKSVMASGHFSPAVLAFVGSYIGVIYYLGVVYRLFTAAPVPVRVTETTGSRLVWSGVFLGSAVFFMFMLVPGVFHTLLMSV
jgi:NADH-quinone oxidoreductase subunit N